MTRILAGTLGACLVWLYAGTASDLLVEWLTSADSSYGLILGAVVVALVWQRRRLIAPAADSPWATAAGLIVGLSGLLLYLAGVFAADQFATRASFVVVSTGLILFLAGARVCRVLAAPLFFLLLAIPLPQLIVNTITLPLQLIASWLAELTLTAARVPVFREGNVLELPSVTLQIVEACSGLRSAISLVSVGALLAWSTGGSMMRRALLAIAAIPIAVFMNGMRVAATGLVSEAWGPELTHGSWHTATGWVTFVVSLAMLLGVEWWLSRSSRAIHAPQVAVA